MALASVLLDVLGPAGFALCLARWLRSDRYPAVLV